MTPSEVDSTKDVEKKSVQRRINKPLIEKRRRARINDSLAQLKAIVLESSDAKGRPSKLEKADILEMTVDFIKKKTTPTSYPGLFSNEPPSAQSQDEYSAGYSKCLTEISRFLEETRSVDDASKRLIEHISKKFKPANEDCNGPADATTTNKKIRIEPLKYHSQRINSESSCGAVDLSIRGANSKQVSDAGTAQSAPSDGHVLSSQTNQQVPVGLVCGGHVMLLVQLPSSMTSQQMIKPNVISVNSQMQTASSTMPLGFVQATPTLSRISTSPSSTQTLSIPTNSTQNLSSCLVSTTSITKTRLKTEPKDSGRDGDNTSTVTINNKAVGVDKNHWRPW